MAPNVCSLFAWSNWLTPTFQKKRFDTRFFISTLSEPVQQFECGFEMTGSDWLEPERAMREFAANSITLRIPQIYELNRAQK